MNVCPICQNIFELKNKWKKKTFCSRSCAAKYRTRVLRIFPDKTNGKYLKCKVCENQVYTTPSVEKNKFFCSVKCRAKFFGKSTAEKKKNGKHVECPICKKTKYTSPSTLALNKYGMRFCSRKCKHEAMKKGMADWGFRKTGNKTSGNSYIRKGSINRYEHRRVMEAHLGRKLLRSEHIHHINENPKDNRIENLMIISSSEHARLHKRR